MTATRRPLRIGHRGAAGHARENTKASFTRALEIGVDFIETDLRRTAEGEIVLCHDPWLRTRHGAHIAIASASLAELRASVQPDVDLMTLDELLSTIQEEAGLMLELKVTGIAETVNAIVRQAGFSAPLIYASFHHDEVRRVRDIAPDANTLALIHGAPVNRSAFAVDAGASHAGINVEFADSFFVNELHAAERQVFVYTANEAADIARLMHSGVDGIISDYPERIPR